MTEIPEHLLARSRARRAEATDTAAAAGDTPTTGGAVEKAVPAGTPAAAAAAVPATAPAPPPPPKPDPPYIQAAKDRKKIPFWVMPVLVGLPLWALLYAFTLEPPTKKVVGWQAQGQAIYAQCATCHGATGEGGVGPAFNNGALAQTFPDYKTQIEWVSLGSAGWSTKHGGTYGAQHKPVQGGMPAWSTEDGGTLSPDQITIIVRYEREIISGLPANPDLDAAAEAAALNTGAAAGGEHN